MDARLIDEVNMMVRQLKVAGFWCSTFPHYDTGKWHVRLEGDGCFAGTTRETHAYLSGALAIHHRVEYLADRAEREKGERK